jgi:hypothetical protein
MNARRQWRCFDCDAVFRSEYAAGIHFGADQSGTCACVLPHEQHLVEHIRDLEGRLDSYRDDRDPVLRSIMALEGEHSRALQREEEKGYERGMRDVRPYAAECALEIVREEWHRAVNEFGLAPGTPTEAVTARILERLNSLKVGATQ